MTDYEYYRLLVNIIGTIGIVASAIYVSLQFRRSAKIHQQNFDWNKRIETRKKLDDNRFDSNMFLNEKFCYIGNKHTIPVSEILKKIEEDSQIVVHLHRLLSYYEALANVVENNIYDEHLIKSSRRGSMIHTFTLFKDWIEYDRREANPKYYIKFEGLIQKWINEEKNEQGLEPLGKA